MHLPLDLIVSLIDMEPIIAKERETNNSPKLTNLHKALSDILDEMEDSEKRPTRFNN